MDKQKLLNQYSRDKESRNFFAQSLDKLEQSRHCPSATGFFSPEEQADFSGLLQQIHNPLHLWLGGFPQAVRNICYFPADWQEDLSQEELQEELIESEYPLTFLEGQCGTSVNHRDVLGSIMGLGLSRRKIGDIYTEDKLCQVVVLPETAGILLSQWESVGRGNVSLREIPYTELRVPELRTKDIYGTVASLRLDSLVATGFSLSRSKASTLIIQGKILVNHREVGKVDFLLSQGDLLSCRGLGNCKLLEVGGQSRKGRIQVTMAKYV